MENGGWIEQTEIEISAYCDDNTREPNSAVEELAELSHELGKAYGTEFRIADRMEAEMRNAGFVDVINTKFKLPLGPWSADPKYKEIGKFYERYYKTGAEGWIMHILTQRMGVSAIVRSEVHAND
jgi:hypothetical protein